MNGSFKGFRHFFEEPMSKIKILLLGCLVVGLYQNWELIGNTLSPPPAVTVSGPVHIVLYATQWCGYCAKTRKFFARNSIPYQELDVEKSEQGRIDYQKFGGGGVPIIVLNGSTVIRGFDPEAIQEALQQKTLE